MKASNLALRMDEDAADVEPGEIADTGHPETGNRAFETRVFDVRAFEVRAFDTRAIVLREPGLPRFRVR